MLEIEHDVSLANLSTIQIGGKAKYFTKAKTDKDLIEALQFAATKKIPHLILGQGSNTLFGDGTFEGLIIQIATTGISSDSTGLVTARAGEPWDNFVQYCIQNNFTGVECLSGIPGLVGATPIQNVGAYGQEVSQTITSVRALEIASRKVRVFTADECQFNYRTSRFKTVDQGKFVITEVSFQLTPDSQPKIIYHELFTYIKSRLSYKTLTENKDRLAAVREAVLDIRGQKSMLINANDPNSKSLGSFFLNPIISKDRCAEILKLWKTMPYFNFGSEVKISAAWLLENSGYRKGHIYKDVGTSENHCLAIINRGKGTSKQVKELCQQMQKAVYEKFGIQLVNEPNFIDC